LLRSVVRKLSSIRRPDSDRVPVLDCLPKAPHSHPWYSVLSKDRHADVSVQTGENAEGFDFPNVREAGPNEAGPIEAGPIEAGPNEAGPIEAGPIEAGPIEAGPNEAGPIEAGPIEAGPIEAGPIEAGPIEAGPIEAGPNLMRCDHRLTKVSRVAALIFDFAFPTWIVIPSVRDSVLHDLSNQKASR